VTAAREGQQNGKGYAPSSASTHLEAAVVGLRERGVKVSGDDQAEARTALEGLAVKLLQAGNGADADRQSAPRAASRAAAIGSLPRTTRRMRRCPSDSAAWATQTRLPRPRGWWAGPDLGEDARGRACGQGPGQLVLRLVRWGPKYPITTLPVTPRLSS
jgi:hypothetical protein